MPSPVANWNPWWAAALSFFLLLQCVAMAYTTPTGVPPDEFAHLSYVRDVADGRFVPDYAEGRIRDSTQGNYLSHPPLYYSLLGKATQAAGVDPFAAAKPLRLASAVFVAIGFGLWLLAARMLGAPLHGVILATLATCATPMFGFSAGSVNNDSLLYLGIGLFAFGVSREVVADRRDRMAAFALVAGAITVFLTKATGASFLVFFVALLLPRKPAALLDFIRARRNLAMFAIVAVACGAWFTYALVAFGGLLPRPAALYPHAPPADPMTPAAYAWRYATIMWERLPIVMSHATVRPFFANGATFFHALVVLPMLAWLVARPGAVRRGADPRVARGCDALALAALATIALHIAYTYFSYRETGLLAGMQPRYFAFLLPALWLPAFLLERRRRPQAALVLAFSACAAIAFWTSVPFAAQKQAAAVAASKTGQPKAKAPAAPAAAGVLGNLDDFRLLPDGSLELRGWAFDAARPGPVGRIAVFGDGALLASLETGDPRPDVARALGNPDAGSSGFSSTVDAAGVRPCALGIAAEGPGGRVLWLRRPSCGESPRLP